jgi:hypothetical protein
MLEQYLAEAPEVLALNHKPVLVALPPFPMVVVVAAEAGRVVVAGVALLERALLVPLGARAGQ